MNPINARDKIKKIGNLIGTKTDSLPMLTLPKGWFASQWDSEFRENLNSVIMDEKGLLKLPFEDFCFSLPPCAKSQDDPEPFTEIYGIVNATNELVKLSMFACFIKENGSHMQFTCVYFVGRDGNTNNARIYMVDTKKNKLNRVPDSDLLAGLRIVAPPLTIIAHMFSSVEMHAVIISPPPHKSASFPRTWRMAREYYSVIHRRHQANNRASVEGSSISDSSSAFIAHSRRAHQRILRSIKWGKNTGKKLWVKACWVGPKEWQDAESKQIYRIVERGLGTPKTHPKTP